MYEKKKHVHAKSMNQNNLKVIMWDANLSYEHLSKKTGVSKSTLCRIANYEQSPTQDIMICIARGLNIKVVDIFNYDY